MSINAHAQVDNMVEDTELILRTSNRLCRRQLREDYLINSAGSLNGFDAALNGLYDLEAHDSLLERSGFPTEDQEFVSLATSMMQPHASAFLQAMASGSRPSEELIDRYGPVRTDFVHGEIMMRAVDALDQRPKLSHCAWSMAVVELKVMWRGRWQFHTPYAVRCTFDRAKIKFEEDCSFIRGLLTTHTPEPAQVGEQDPIKIGLALCRLWGLQVEPGQDWSQEVQAQMRSHDEEGLRQILAIQKYLRKLRKAQLDVAAGRGHRTPKEASQLWRAMITKAKLAVAVGKDSERRDSVGHRTPEEASQLWSAMIAKARLDVAVGRDSERRDSVGHRTPEEASQLWRAMIAKARLDVAVGRDSERRDSVGHRTPEEASQLWHAMIAKAKLHAAGRDSHRTPEEASELWHAMIAKAKSNSAQPNTALGRYRYSYTEGRDNVGQRTPREALGHWRTMLVKAFHAWVSPKMTWPGAPLRDIMLEVEALCTVDDPMGPTPGE